MEDDTLILIFERIASPVTLIRAASTCRRWRRLIADADFLRRYRSLYGPTVGGGYWNGYYPVHGPIPSFVPSSPSIDARHFSLDFLADVGKFPPPPRHYTTPAWQVLNSRGSLLLMESQTHRPRTIFPDIVVCEPPTRRYRIIPPPPDSDNNDNQSIFLGPYLVDGDEDEAGGRIGMSNFRVLSVLFTVGVVHTTVFTAMTSTWSDKAIDHIVSNKLGHCVYLGQALDSLYYYDRTLVTLDCSTGKFSSAVLSHAIRNCWDRHRRRGVGHYFFVIDGGDGKPRVVSVLDNIMEVFARLDGEWALEKKVLLSKVICGLPGYQPSFSNKPLTILKRGVGFIVMSFWVTSTQGFRFSIDLKTMEVAPAPEARGEHMTFRCEFPWPPALQANCLDG